MQNPIIQALEKKPQNNILNMMAMLKNGNADAIFTQMLQSNPQFKSFVEQNKGKTAHQIANEYGIDLQSLGIK